MICLAKQPKNKPSPKKEKTVLKCDSNNKTKIIVSLLRIKRIKSEYLGEFVVSIPSLNITTNFLFKTMCSFCPKCGEETSDKIKIVKMVFFGSVKEFQKPFSKIGKQVLSRIVYNILWQYKKQENMPFEKAGKNIIIEIEACPKLLETIISACI